jgi:hypothetical protein
MQKGENKAKEKEKQSREAEEKKEVEQQNHMTEEKKSRSRKAQKQKSRKTAQYKGERNPKKKTTKLEKMPQINGPPKHASVTSMCPLINAYQKACVYIILRM